MKLYEIDAEINNVLTEYHNAVDETGELMYGTEELDNKYEMLLHDRQVKLVNCALFIKNCRAEAEAIKEEEANLRKRRHRLERMAESTENLIDRYAHGESVKDARCEIAWRKSEVVEILGDVENLEKKYQRIKIEADKTAIKKAIKSGLSVKNAALIEKQNLQIK